MAEMEEKDKGKSPPDPSLEKGGKGPVAQASPPASAEAKAVAGETPALRKPAPSDAVVDQWVVEFFYNSPIARNTDCWNLLMRAKEVLKERLRPEEKKS